MESKYHRLLKASFLCGLFALLSFDTTAQITPPGYEREIQAMEQRKRTNILDLDSVTIIDTITLLDPSTFEETIKVIRSNRSWRDYMTLRLGINQPDVLLNGAPLTITDPGTYEKLVIQWNSSASKLDTIRQ